MSLSSSSIGELKSLLGAKQASLVVGAYDAVSAKLIEKAGFPIVYVGSYATSASQLGVPDVGLLSLQDMTEHAQRIVDTVKVPVIADAENGFTNAANIWRTVHLFERAGVSAIHIEDHEFGKHAKVNQTLLSLDQMNEKIRAAVDARKEMLIIARTDAKWVLNDLNEAVRRANAFFASGADLVFLVGVSPEELRIVRGRILGKVSLIHTPGFSIEEEQRSGASLVFYYDLTLLAAYQAVKTLLTSFKQRGITSSFPDTLDFREEFEEFIGMSDFVTRAKKYKLG